MTTYTFEIVVGGIKIVSNDDLFDISDALFEAGCTDSHPAAYGGTLYVPFTRESDSYETAVETAIEQIESIDGLKCVSIDVGGIVSLADAAELAGLTRATLSKYSKGQRGNGDFPSPISRVDSSRPLWSWSDVAAWLEHRGAVDSEIVTRANTTHAINTALTIRNDKMIKDVEHYLNFLNKKNAA